jgi:RNA polymerase subunit RPABC4/transcription elongation factor Spt4
MSSGMPQTNLKSSRSPDGVAHEFVCPYCGAINEAPEGQCPQCTMENTAAGRKATKARIGPWYVLQKRNPAAPGMKFETLLSFVNKGRVKAHSIIRGPTTHQLWKFAAQVRGLSREFGLCYSCGAGIDREAAICPQCNRTQTLPAQPDVFLESAEGEAPATVFRELPASLVPPAQVPTQPSANADPSPANADLQPAASDMDVIVKPLGTSKPVANDSRDMVIPSLPEAPSPAIARPTSPRERLANLNRALAGESEPAEIEDPGESAFDDGPTRPPGQVGPAFVAGGRAPQSRRGRRKWPEAAMFVLVLLAAAGSGLLYVDPALQTRVQSWTNNMLAMAGITSAPKQAAAPLPGTDANPANPIPLTLQPPVGANDEAATIALRSQIASTPASSHPAAPAPMRTPEEVNVATPENTTNTSQVPSPPIANSAQPTVPVAQPAPVVTAPTPADNPSVDTSSAPQSDDDDPFAKARNLRRKAIDAENSGDYAVAVSLFEQIKDLPRDAWPGDLELRLKAAKANADGAPRR